mmetsp:Transcript_37706/g.60396  ORF Transcript_37706/g.60396 Transcript_37706/m.60396 type:complete len:372 (+) Transcript_37706:216-1331(+)
MLVEHDDAVAAFVEFGDLFLHVFDAERKHFAEFLRVEFGERVLQIQHEQFVVVHDGRKRHHNVGKVQDLLQQFVETQSIQHAVFIDAPPRRLEAPSAVSRAGSIHNASIQNLLSVWLPTPVIALQIFARCKRNILRRVLVHQLLVIVVVLARRCCAVRRCLLLLLLPLRSGANLDAVEPEIEHNHRKFVLHHHAIRKYVFPRPEQCVVLTLFLYMFLVAVHLSASPREFVHVKVFHIRVLPEIGRSRVKVPSARDIASGDQAVHVEEGKDVFIHVIMEPLELCAVIIIVFVHHHRWQRGLNRQRLQVRDGRLSHFAFVLQINRQFVVLLRFHVQRVMDQLVAVKRLTVIALKHDIAAQDMFERVGVLVAVH